MTRNAHRRHKLGQLKHLAYVLLLLSMSVLLCLLTCIVWEICWTVILCPP